MTVTLLKWKERNTFSYKLFLLWNETAQRVIIIVHFALLTVQWNVLLNSVVQCHLYVDLGFKKICSLNSFANSIAMEKKGDKIKQYFIEFGAVHYVEYDKISQEKSCDLAWQTSSHKLVCKLSNWSFSRNTRC